MSLEIIGREQEGIEILNLNGRLTFGQEDLDFRSELDRLVKSVQLRVALNLADLRQLDTTGLGTLLFALAKLRKAGGPWQSSISNRHISNCSRQQNWNRCSKCFTTSRMRLTAFSLTAK
jgi:anti-anti-sigma regulatory factor